MPTNNGFPWLQHDAGFVHPQQEGHPETPALTNRVGRIPSAQRELCTSDKPMLAGGRVPNGCVLQWGGPVGLCPFDIPQKANPVIIKTRYTNGYLRTT